MAPLHSQLLVYSTLILLLNVQLTHFTSTITAMAAKEQISCTMCSSCDNPCQPIFSPPPPSSSPPPLPPPSPSQSLPLSPPYYGGGGGCCGGDGGDGDYYYPLTDPSGYPIPPPPNPIVPYFPFYYHNPPTPYTVVDSKSVHFYNHSFISCLILALSIFL